jgi:hypothetical protein
MIRVPLHLSTGIDCQNRKVAGERTRRYSPDLPRMGSGLAEANVSSIRNEVSDP